MVANDFSSSRSDDRNRRIFLFIQRLVVGLGLINGRLVIFVHDGDLTKISVHPDYNVFADKRTVKPVTIDLPYGREWIETVPPQFVAEIRRYGRVVVTVEKGRVSEIEWRTREKPATR